MVSRRRHGRASQVVEVSAGVDQRVKITLPPGGAVRVHATANDRFLANGRPRRFRIRLRGAGQLEDLDLDLEYLSLTRDGDYRAERHWTLGETETSECVPTGRYSVTATLDPFPPIEREIEIKSGVVTDLKLVFE
ncbi:hypothetical protein [Planctomycetes bacterium Poly30]